MNKSANFTGQPIFSQVLKLIDPSLVNRSARKLGTDRYYKKFTTYNHLVTMLYTIFHKCSSIREVVTGMQVCSQRLNHLGLNYSPRRSTFSEGNTKRNSRVFESIYLQLYKQYRGILPDSRLKTRWFSKLYIVDSTTISLFKEILKNAGTRSLSGKRKGGIKVHALIKATEDVPQVIKMTAAAKHDTPFIKGLKLAKGSIIVFDKGYLNHNQFDLWTKEKISWVTRRRASAVYDLKEENTVSVNQKSKGVISDQNIVLGHTSHNDVTRVEARLVRYLDKKNNKIFEFITNNKTLAPATIALIYKHRWQIETLFKRLKQNYPLEYFLGESENAIRIQIWCALIADLLIKIIQSKLKRKWSTANLNSMIRIHLMTYIKLYEFLNNPEKSLINEKDKMYRGPTLF